MAEDLDACAEGRPLPHTRPRGLSARGGYVIRRRPRTAAALVIVVVAAASAGAAAWYERRITTTDCAEIVERFGVPECIVPAPGGAASVWYRIESRAGRVVRMLRQNASGQLLEQAAGPEKGVAEWRFEYGEDEAIGGFGHDAHGKKILAWSFQKGAGGAQVVDKKYTVDDSPREGRRLVLDPNGYVAEERFQNALGAEATDESGARGYSYRRDAHGKVIDKKPIPRE
jgi:hypothetical protein